jgi:hypothetical protein
MPITVTRLSDGAKHNFADISPKSFVKSLKSAIKNEFSPVNTCV